MRYILKCQTVSLSVLEYKPTSRHHPLGFQLKQPEADVDADCVVFVHLHRLLHFFDTLNGQLVDVTVLHDQLHSAALMDFDQFNRLVY